ncbi:MAG: hypothetical protein M3410_16320 [Acidobacteriota bacterium]|nr:hypothetical protein [Acidobacteriota bacterium]
MGQDLINFVTAAAHFAGLRTQMRFVLGLTPRHASRASDGKWKLENDWSA